MSTVSESQARPENPSSDVGEEPGSGDAGDLGPNATRRRRIRAPSTEQRRQRRRLMVVAAVFVAAVGFLLYKGLTSAVVFFKTADEAIAQRATLGTSTFQLEGTVVPGTVRRAAAGVVDFTVENRGVKIAVANSGSPPQLFQAGIPVVVVGHFVGATDRFASSEILVKHSNSYIAAHPNRVRALNGSSR